MHAHLAFWGAYAALIFAFITYALPQMTGRKLYDTWMAEFAFWASNIGMVLMTTAFGIAGVAQVVLERRMGMDFLATQTEIQPHFIGLLLAATFFTMGILAYIWVFIKSGLPTNVVGDVYDK